MVIDKLKIITSNFDIPPDRIDLSIGQPGTSLLPLAALAQAAQHGLTRENPYILAYGAEQGNWYFHNALAGFLSEHYKLSVDPDRLFTTTGISQGLDFICRLFTRPGDTIFVEKKQAAAFCTGNLFSNPERLFHGCFQFSPIGCW